MDNKARNYNTGSFGDSNSLDNSSLQTQPCNSEGKVNKQGSIYYTIIILLYIKRKENINLTHMGTGGKRRKDSCTTLSRYVISWLASYREES